MNGESNFGDDDKKKIQKKKVRIQLLRDNIESLQNIDSWLYDQLKVVHLLVNLALLLIF
jgi:hypothetical protein